MITINYETDFSLQDENKHSKWASLVIKSEGFKEGEINYIFCDDDYLLKLNKEFLKHNTLTDIISFDYSIGKQIHGDIYISVERVSENAIKFKIEFLEELQRVMIHGILHYCGYKDKLESDEKQMRERENYYLGKYSDI